MRSAALSILVLAILCATGCADGDSVARGKSAYEHSIIDAGEPPYGAVDRVAASEDSPHIGAWKYYSVECHREDPDDPADTVAYCFVTFDGYRYDHLKLCTAAYDTDTSGSFVRGPHEVSCDHYADEAAYDSAHSTD